MPDSSDPSLEKAHQQGNRGLLREMVSFALENKKYWMIPLVVVLLLAGLLILFSGSSMAPFFYPLF